MDDELKREFSSIAEEVRATAIPESNKESALYCINRLPALYAKLCSTSESRYGDEITLLVQGVVKELVQNKQPCPKAAQLAAAVPGRFNHFHEQWGLPALALKVPRPPAARSRKVG